VDTVVYVMGVQFRCVAVLALAFTEVAAAKAVLTDCTVICTWRAGVGCRDEETYIIDAPNSGALGGVGSGVLGGVGSGVLGGGGSGVLGGVLGGGLGCHAFAIFGLVAGVACFGTALGFTVVAVFDVMGVRFRCVAGLALAFTVVAAAKAVLADYAVICTWRAGVVCRDVETHIVNAPNSGALGGCGSGVLGGGGSGVLGGGLSGCGSGVLGGSGSGVLGGFLGGRAGGVRSGVGGEAGWGRCECPLNGVVTRTICGVRINDEEGTLRSALIVDKCMFYIITVVTALYEIRTRTVGAVSVTETGLVTGVKVIFVCTLE
jgi:hypothetical protein